MDLGNFSNSVAVLYVSFNDGPYTLLWNGSFYILYLMFFNLNP